MMVKLPTVVTSTVCFVIVLVRVATYNMQLVLNVAHFNYFILLFIIACCSRAMPPRKKRRPSAGDDLSAKKSRQDRCASFLK